MKKLVIKGPFALIGHLPFVVLDKEAGIFKVYGYLLEQKKDVDMHFEKIHEWINNYIKEPNDSTDFYFGFHYIHTYGIKCIFEFIKKIRAIPNLNIFWVCDPEDIVFDELIVEISREINLGIKTLKPPINENMLYIDK